MFFPIGDTPNPRNFTPWVNWLLIAVNVAIYALITFPRIAQPVDLGDPLLRDYLRLIAPSLPSFTSLRQVLAHISAYDLFVFAHGYKPAAPEIRDLFFALFLHANFWHLAGNMLFLWIYGDNVEHRLGRLGYLCTYLATGVAATLFFALWAGASMAPLIGASGAISGVLGLYFLLFPRNKVKLFIAFFPFFVDVILLPARWVLGFYLLIDNVFPFVFDTQSGVAYGAHIGGFLAGLMIAWGGEQFAWQWPWRDRFWRLGRLPRKAETVLDQTQSPGSALTEIRAALADNAPARALDAIAKLDRREMTELKPEECVVLASWLDETGHQIAAARLLRNCLAIHPGSGSLADVYLLMGLMRLRQGQPTAAYQHLLSVFDYDPSPQTAERARQALARIDIFRRRP